LRFRASDGGEEEDQGGTKAHPQGCPGNGPDGTT